MRRPIWSHLWRSDLSFLFMMESEKAAPKLENRVKSLSQATSSSGVPHPTVPGRTVIIQSASSGSAPVPTPTEPGTSVTVVYVKKRRGRRSSLGRYPPGSGSARNPRRNRAALSSKDKVASALTQV